MSELPENEDSMPETPAPEQQPTEQPVETETTVTPKTPGTEGATSEETVEDTAPVEESGDSDEAEISTSEVVVSEDKKHRFHFGPERLLPGPLRRRFHHHARLAGSVVLILLIAVIGGGVWALRSHQPAAKPVARFQAPIAPFALVSTSPAKDATDVSTASKLTFDFNEPVDPTKITKDVFISPASINGTFSQGKDANEIVFTPNQLLTPGTTVSVMLNGTFQSNRGAKLGADHYYTFNTALAADSAVFSDSYAYDNQLTSLSSGQQDTYSLSLGGDVGPSVNVTLYKGTIPQLLQSLAYQTITSEDGYSYPSFSSQSVDVSSLQAVESAKSVKNNGQYTVSQPDGLYVAVATDSEGHQVGFVWIDVTNFGVMLRQDDQKVVLDAQSLGDQQQVSTNVTFYNLENGVNQIGQVTVNGLTTASLPFKPSLDVAVADNNGEQAVIPVSILDTQGDIRADQDLSSKLAIYGITDKPSYKVGETLNYSAFVRSDNDAQYALPSSGQQVNLYVSTDKYGTPLASFSASVDSDGMISGSLPITSDWLTPGNDHIAQLGIFAKSADGKVDNAVSVAGFTVTDQANATDTVTVHFAKTDYLPSDNISATITATDAKGQPMANAVVSVHTLAEDYYENDPVSNLDNFGSLGYDVKGSPQRVTLNAQGQGTITVDPKELPADGTSQQVTVQANVRGTKGPGAAGGATVIIHQASGSLLFAPGRDAIPPGQALVGRVYAKQLDGSPMANAAIQYKLVGAKGETETTLAHGSTTSNGNGLAVITLTVPASASQYDSLQLVATTSDQYHNQLEASNYYFVGASDDKYDTSGAVLEQLDVSGSTGNVSVGDTVNLTINTPSAIQAMVTMDRGRIYNQKLVHFNAGNNTFSFKVTANLAPSFTLTFGYFVNGVYHSEGTQFNVSEASHKANVALTAPHQAVKANKSVNVAVNVSDSNGHALPASLIVDAVSSNAYNYTNRVTPPIFATLFTPQPIMTSSSSSLTTIGGGGGKCGGGGWDTSGFSSALSTTLSWQPKVSTNSSGTAVIKLTPPKGSWTVTVYAMSDNTVVGSSSTTITAK
ncbi:MAG TPA: Ig-like domain-containing protein [Candidatus Saccharimonadales bacterium]|nr:Ig-like domain-containing protein [Candidatus Saccharimonadales bacterium]